MSSSRKRRQALIRVGNDELQYARIVHAPTLVFSNAAQFDDLNNGLPLVLFYRSGVSDDQPIFDPENDVVLEQLHVDPFADTSLALYEACITRAYFECKVHPDQAAALDLVRSTLPSAADGLIVFVYKRDNAQTSPVENRRANPFHNPYNGIRDQQPSAEVLLFTRYSFEPFVRASIVWQTEPRVNSSVGLFAISVVARLY